MNPIDALIYQLLKWRWPRHSQVRDLALRELREAAALIRAW